MSTVKRTYKNMVYLSIAELVSKSLQFVLMVYAARLLDQQSFGKFSLALSLSFIAIIISDMGVNTLLIREVARDKKIANKFFTNAAALKLGFVIITYILLAAALYFIGYPKETLYVIYIIWTFAVVSTFTELFYSVFRAFENMLFDALIKIARMLLLTPLGLYVLFKYHNVLVFSFVFVFVELLILAAAYLISSRKFIKPKWEFDTGLMKDMLLKSLPFGLAFVFGSIYLYIGSVILSKIRGDVEVALYSVAYNLVIAILFIPIVYTNAIFPVMSRYYKTSKENLILIYKKSFKYLYILGLPISVGLYLLAGRIIFLFYGKDYAKAVIALQIMSWFVVFKFVNFVTGYLLSSADYQRNRMINQGFAALFNVVLSFILIYKIGYIGAALTILITEVFLFILYYWNVSKNVYSYNFIPILIKPIIATAAMAAFIKYTNFRLILIIPLSALVYFAMIFVLKTFEKEDYEIFRKAILKP